MTLDFSSLKSIDQQTNLLVFGYVNDIHSLLKFKDKPREIATDVILICLLFVHHVQMERFGECSDKEHVQILSKEEQIDNIAQIKTPYKYVHVHGVQDIDFIKNDNTIYEWIFQVNTLSISIGIDSNISRKYQDIYIFGKRSHPENNRFFYALADDGRLEYADSNGDWDFKKKKKYLPNSIGHNDKIKMILDTAQRSLSFKRNGKEFGIAYNDIDTSKVYHMAVVMCSFEGKRVELTDFKKYINFE